MGKKKVKKSKEVNIVEVADEVVRTNRYGRRNYRNSIGADHRRHWRDDFIVSEEHEEEIMLDELDGGIVLDPDDFEYDGGEDGEREVDDLIRESEEIFKNTGHSVDDAIKKLEEEENAAMVEDTRLHEEFGSDIADKLADEEQEIIANPDE